MAHGGWRRRTMVITVLVLGLGAVVPSDPAGSQGDPSLGGAPTGALPSPPSRNEDVALADGTLREAVAELEDGGDTDAEVDVDGERIRVEILHHTTDAAVRQLVRGLGGTIDGSVPGVLAEGEVPFDRLEELEAAPAIDFVRPPLPVNEPVQDGTGLPGSGSTVGEDVARTNAEDWQAAGITGAGVKVGVIDLFGSSAWNAAEAAGEVPVPAGTFCSVNGDTSPIARSSTPARSTASPCPRSSTTTRPAPRSTSPTSSRPPTPRPPWTTSTARAWTSSPARSPLPTTGPATGPARSRP